MFRKVLVFLLLFSLLVSASACAGTDSTQNTVSDAATETSTRIVTDQLGREVEIPTTVERIVPLGNAPRMITYLGLADKVVGIGSCEINTQPMQAYAYPQQEKWSKLPNVGTDAMGETAYYPEEIIAANPDVILCTYTEDVADDIQTKTGIPVVSVAMGTLFGDDFNQALHILGDVCGVKERADSVIQYIDDCLTDIEARVEEARKEGGEQPSVLAAGATFKGSHSIDGVYIDYPVFELLSANDVTDDLDTTGQAMAMMVDREQILKWNPDMIFFDATSLELVNADYAATPDYFEELKAVKTGELYRWPNSTYHYSNVEIPILTTYYVGKLLYPEAFTDVEIEQKASEIFDFFLGEPDFLNELEAADMGYGKIELGK